MYTIRNNTNRLYTIWTEARRRARNPRQSSYMNKDIVFCSEWDDYLAFREWSLNNGYSDNLSLDRIDNTSGYNPSNCQWTDRNTQQLNMRKKTIKNASSKYIGVSKMKTTRRAKAWRARMYIKGKEILIGYFKEEEEAAKARDLYAKDNNLNVVLNFMV